MELKTLKDIFWGEITNRCLCGSCDEGMGCDIKKIKKEAIKWIMDSRNSEVYEEDMFGKIKRECYNNNMFDREDIMGELFIKFFNITEEDLK